MDYGTKQRQTMKEDWTEQLRRKLENYEVEPPPGLWEDICKQMGLEPEPASNKPVVSRWWWAAAAAVLALVGFFVFYNPRNEQPLQANAVSQKRVPEQSSSEQSLVQEFSPQQPLKAIVLRHHADTPVIPEPAEKQEIMLDMPSGTVISYSGSRSGEVCPNALRATSKSRRD